MGKAGENGSENDWRDRIYDEFVQPFGGDFDQVERLLGMFVPVVAAIFRLMRGIGAGGRPGSGADAQDAARDLCFLLIDEFPDSQVGSPGELLDWVVSRAVSGASAEPAAAGPGPPFTLKRFARALRRVEGRRRRVLRERLRGRPLSEIAQDLKRDAGGAAEGVTDEEWTAAAGILFYRGLAALISALEEQPVEP